MATTAELQKLSADEQEAFRLVQDGSTEPVISLIDHGRVRVNCLDNSGMNLLDQAAFKGNVPLAKALIARGADADNRAHQHGYTGLMFAALAGKPELCELLLNAGARPHAMNNMNKTAAELAAFVACHECVSLINSYITREEVDRIIHPKGAASEERFGDDVVDYIHQLTRTHFIHPVTIALGLCQRSSCVQHLKKIVFVVDRLFEKQLRCKDPNEVLSVKLWFVLSALRKIDSFLKCKSEMKPTKALHGFCKVLASWRETDGVVCRPLLERYLFATALGFPYQHSMMFKMLGRALKSVQRGVAPNVFTVISGSVFGQRFAVCAGFCSFCGKPNPNKQCSECTVLYCSETCQRADWCTHRSVCAALKANPTLNGYMKPVDDATYITS